MSELFVKVSNVEDLRTSHMKAVEVENEIVCLANVDGKFYAIGANRAVALLFGGGTAHTLAIPICTVMDALKIVDIL